MRVSLDCIIKVAILLSLQANLCHLCPTNLQSERIGSSPSYQPRFLSSPCEASTEENPHSPSPLHRRHPRYNIQVDCNPFLDRRHESDLYLVRYSLEHENLTNPPRNPETGSVEYWWGATLQDTWGMYVRLSLRHRRHCEDEYLTIRARAGQHTKKILYVGKDGGVLEAPPEWKRAERSGENSERQKRKRRRKELVGEGRKGRGETSPKQGGPLLHKGGSSAAEATGESSSDRESDEIPPLESPSDRFPPGPPLGSRKHLVRPGWTFQLLTTIRNHNDLLPYSPLVYSESSKSSRLSSPHSPFQKGLLNSQRSSSYEDFGVKEIHFPPHSPLRHSESPKYSELSSLSSPFQKRSSGSQKSGSLESFGVKEIHFSLSDVSASESLRSSQRLDPSGRESRGKRRLQ